jgi:hypothetical protein
LAGIPFVDVSQVVDQTRNVLLTFIFVVMDDRNSLVSVLADLLLEVELSVNDYIT